MSVLVKIEDGAGKVHDVVVHTEQDFSELAEHQLSDATIKAVDSLRAWVGHGTTKADEPLEVVSTEEHVEEAKSE